MILTYTTHWVFYFNCLVLVWMGYSFKHISSPPCRFMSALLSVWLPSASVNMGGVLKEKGVKQ